MLNQLLALLESRENGLSLAEISREMKSQPTAVKAMMDLLVKKGKILEVGPDGKYCEACGLQSDCNLLKARGKRYAVTSIARAADFGSGGTAEVIKQ
jgi:predicted Zn-ribbon and HTH transcriptional regulator